MTDEAGGFHCNKVALVSKGMSIPLENLPKEELLLLHAVEGLEYMFSIARLYPITLAIVNAYGLDLDGPEYENSTTRLRFEDLVDDYKRQINYNRAGRLEWDRHSLNTRSTHLLALLCALSHETLMQPGDVLHHRFYKAGREACFCLANLGLLHDTEGGTFTSEGKKLSDHALSEEFKPLSDFTFEDIE